MSKTHTRKNPGRTPLPSVIPFSKVTPQRLHWLSPGRIAAGKLTILDGDPGVGKSSLLCELAARVSRGDPLPGGDPAPPRSVILMSAEDDPYDTIRPRLDAAGADPRRIIALGAVALGPGGALLSIPEHNDTLLTAIYRMRAALVIIDPLAAFLSHRLNTNSDQAVRRALASLKGVAERSGVAIVAVRHLNKSAAANPLYRGGGSIGIIGAARCGLLLALHPDDPQRRILAATKANLGRLPPSLVFRLESAPGADVARVVWEGQTDLAATDLLRDTIVDTAARSVLTEARVWLRAALADGPRPASELLREAGTAGIPPRLLYTARKAERVQIRKERVTGGRWLWSYEDSTREFSTDPPSP